MYNPSMRRRLPIVFLSIGFALLTLLPYWVANQFAGSGLFTGVLINPMDGASYLAKMHQGWEGSWRYALAFTDSPGPGAFLFTYYLFLGHAARWVGTSLFITYHAARMLGSAFFLVVAWITFERLGMSKRAGAIAWTILVVGSGFGWLAALAGYASSDVWVAEFIPFLSMLTSAHFPIVMACLLLLAVEVILPKEQLTSLSVAGILLATVALAMLQPFALLPMGVALVFWAAWYRLRLGSFPPNAIAKLATIGIGALPFAAYDVWVTRSLPAFVSWAAQNQTPSPPAWDVALGLGPLGALLIFVFARWMIRREPAIAPGDPRLFFIFWLAGMALLLYLPFSLQRRMMLGGFLPVAILAAPHIERWLFAPTLRVRRLVMGLLILPLSNLIVIGAMVHAIGTRNPAFFLSPDETAAMNWLSTHAASGDVVLAPPEFARWIPAFTGLRVVYGHPMETPNAAAALQDVNAFYRGDPGAETILRKHSVHWVYCATDQTACPLHGSNDVEQVWNSGDAQLFYLR
jgi:hypothetical protein